MSVVQEVRICKEGGQGAILPSSDSEWELNIYLRGCMYAFAMIYFFLGVSIVADMFMGAIEAITSRKKQRMLTTGRIVTVRVWNETVANLTLMALGSSAPEILLAVTELFGKNMYFGSLGPATIVGSASFNLFMIIGLCIFVIPSSEVRKVKEVPVFVITSIFMFIAYLWLVVMVAVITPDIVDIWEAVLTFILLPVLVAASYYADIGGFGEMGKTLEVRTEDVARVCDIIGDYTEDTQDAVRAGLASNRELVLTLGCPSPADVVNIRRMVRKFLLCKKSRAARRVEATRAMTGGKRVSWESPPTADNVVHVAGVTGACLQDIPMALPKGAGKPRVQFCSESQHMSEDLTSKSIGVFRSGDVSSGITVTFDVLGPTKKEKTKKTEEDGGVKKGGLAKSFSFLSGSSSEASKSAGTSGTDVPLQASAEAISKLRRTMCVVEEASLSFEPGESFKYVEIKRPAGLNIESRFYEFAVEIKDVVNTTEGAFPFNTVVGDIRRTLVVMSKGENHGRLSYGYDRLLVPGTADTQVVQLIVQRMGACHGTATCSWQTERLTSVPGFGYTEAQGTLEFEEGVTEAFIEVEILPTSATGARNIFLVILEEPEGADFNPFTDGGVDQEILTIEIGPKTFLNSQLSKTVVRWLDEQFSFDGFRLGNEEYKEQMLAAIYCNGSAEEQKEAALSDWIFHIIALPWKLIFMFVPPTAYCGGWACFFMSLVMIGALTAVIGDLAELFGCVAGLPDLLTAILFVALGTSMPDLFASKAAATNDPTADASIVNVTGSNCVNVFLGLGVPWTIGALYWYISEWDVEWARRHADIVASHTDGIQMVFVVRAGELAFSVMLFCLCACIALAMLLIRRRKVGGELGGVLWLKITSSACFVLLWVIHIGLSFWFSLRNDKADTFEKTAVFTTGAVGLAIPVVIFSAIAAIMPAGVFFSESEGAAEAAARKELENFDAVRQETPRNEELKAGDFAIALESGKGLSPGGRDGKVSPWTSEGSNGNVSIGTAPGGHCLVAPYSSFVRCNLSSEGRVV